VSNFDRFENIRENWTPTSIPNLRVDAMRTILVRKDGVVSMPEEVFDELLGAFQSILEGVEFLLEIAEQTNSEAFTEMEKILDHLREQLI
jgi:hypothetical protein